MSRKPSVKAPAFQMFPRSDGAPGGHGDCFWFCWDFFVIPSLKLTWHLKMGHPKKKFIFQPSIFRGDVSFKEGISTTFQLGANYGQLQWTEKKQLRTIQSPLNGIGRSIPSHLGQKTSLAQNKWPDLHQCLVLIRSHLWCTQFEIHWC